MPVGELSVATHSPAPKARHNRSLVAVKLCPATACGCDMKTDIPTEVYLLDDFVRS